MATGQKLLAHDASVTLSIPPIWFLVTLAILVVSENPMFTSLYFYRVPKENIERFLVIQKMSAGIYKGYGAIDDWTFGAENLEAKYGCSSFSTEISVGQGEELFTSLSLFRSKEDHDRIVALVDQDPEIEALFNEVSQLIDISRVVRGEFMRLV